MKFAKKLLVLFLASMLVASVFSLSAFATGETDSDSNIPVLIFNEDFTEVKIDENVYVSVDATYISEYYSSIDIDYQIPYVYKDMVKNIEARASTNNILLDVTIYFEGGTSTNASYIDSHYVSECSHLVSSSDIQMKDFPSGGAEEPFCFTTNELKDAISKEPDVTLYYATLYNCNEYTIIKESKNFTIIRGFLIVDEDGNYYYADCEKSNILEPDNFSIYVTDELEVFTIQDSELLTRMKFLVEEEKADTEKWLIALATIFLIIFCGIIPLITGIICFVFSFKSKKSYKTILRIISSLCVAEMIIFVIAMITALA